MNIWLTRLCFLVIVLAGTYFFYRPNRSKREDSPKYYLVDVTYQGRVYDDDHRFSMMMTREEIVKAWPWNIQRAQHGAVHMGYYGLTGGYGFMELSISCEVTKAEYEKFRDKLDSVASEVLRKGYRYMDELEEDEKEELHEETKDIRGEYYLVATHFRPGGETVFDRYTFQMMLSDEEMETWQKEKPWRPTIDTEDEDYNYKNYSDVKVICEVTKQEYKKFSQRLAGFKLYI